MRPKKSLPRPRIRKHEKMTFFEKKSGNLSFRRPYLWGSKSAKITENHVKKREKRPKSTKTKLLLGRKRWQNPKKRLKLGPKRGRKSVKKWKMWTQSGHFWKNWKKFKVLFGTHFFFTPKQWFWRKVVVFHNFFSQNLAQNWPKSGPLFEQVRSRGPKTFPQIGSTEKVVEKGLFLPLRFLAKKVSQNLQKGAIFDPKSGPLLRSFSRGPGRGVKSGPTNKGFGQSGRIWGSGGSKKRVEKGEKHKKSRFWQEIWGSEILCLPPISERA